MRVASEDVWTLIPRINGRHETLFDEGGPTAQGNVRVTAHFTEGARLDSFVFVPKAVTAPMSEDRVVTKFHNLTRGIVEPGRQRAIIRAVLGLEGLRSISELINLVAPIVSGAFDEHPRCLKVNKYECSMARPAVTRYTRRRAPFDFEAPGVDQCFQCDFC
jgi:aconitate decarboxylase